MWEGLCWIGGWRRGRWGGGVDVERVEGGFETFTAGMRGAEFHVAGDYAFEEYLLRLGVCQSCASSLVCCIVDGREVRYTLSRP